MDRLLRGIPYPAHHPTAAPSSWGRRILCPGSGEAERLAAALPLPSASSPGAARGTAIHAAAEAAFHAEPDPDDDDDEEPSDPDDLSARESEALRSFEEFVSEAMVELAGEFETEAYSELRIEIRGVGDAVRSFGTIDRAYVWTDGDGRGCGALFDLKTHANGILPPTSTRAQLYAYAIGLAQSFGLDRVNALAFAPHGPTTVRLEYFPSEAAAREDVDRIADAAESTGRELVAGWEQCQYCRARPACPEAARNLGERSAILRDMKGNPAIVVTDRGPVVVDDAALGEFWDALTVAAAQIKAARKSIKLALAAGATSKMLRAVTVRGNRGISGAPPPWFELPEEIQALVDAEKYRTTMKVSVSKLREAWIAAKIDRDGGKKVKAEKEFWELMEPWVTRGFEKQRIDRLDP